MSKIRKQILPCFASLCLVLQSCAPSLPQYKNVPSEKINAPQNFPKQTEGDDTDETADLVAKNWKLFFEDPQLVSLIEIALTNNQDLNILDQQISIASNEIMARQGQYLPKVGIAGALQTEKTSKLSSRGATDEAAGLPNHLNNRTLEINASWEVDIWKKLRNFAKSAYYEYLASIEGRKFMVTQIVAEVSSDYFELMALDNQLEIVDQYIKTLQQAQNVIELQRLAARTDSLAVKRFAAEVLKNKSRHYEIQQQIIVTENHLNTLLGRLPQPIERPSKKFIDIKMQQVATNVPSDLLNNRPDVKEAALKLEATKLSVKAVKAQFYPSLNIDANLGYTSFNGKHFINTPTTLFYDAAAGLTAPLLNRNAIKAEYFSANNRQIEAIYNYEQTFIKAFAEVSNQLAAVKNLKQIYSLKAQQTKALAQSFEISNDLFRAARVTYLESLLTRRDYLESQMQLMEIKQQQLAAYVNLYRALGGGWRNEQ